jgi:hypothetical protein
MINVRRALAGLAIPVLAATGAVLAAPAAQAAVPIGCSEPQRLLVKAGWLTTDDDGTVRADPVEDAKGVTQQFRFCTPPDWQHLKTVVRSEATERYLLPDALTGQVRAISSSPSSANVVELHAGRGGGPVTVFVPSAKAYYDAREDLPGTPLYATASAADAEPVEILPLP